MDISHFGLFDLMGARPHWTDGACVAALHPIAPDPAPAVLPAASVPRGGTVVALPGKWARHPNRKLEVGGT